MSNAVSQVCGTEETLDYRPPPSLPNVLKRPMPLARGIHQRRHELRNLKRKIAMIVNWITANIDAGKQESLSHRTSQETRNLQRAHPALDLGDSQPPSTLDDGTHLGSPGSPLGASLPTDLRSQSCSSRCLTWELCYVPRPPPSESRRFHKFTNQDNEKLQKDSVLSIATISTAVLSIGTKGKVG
jgi:hypothetical protein